MLEEEGIIEEWLTRQLKERDMKFHVPIIGEMALSFGRNSTFRISRRANQRVIMQFVHFHPDVYLHE